MTDREETVVDVTQYVLNTCCSLFGNENISLLKDVITDHEDLINKFAADQNKVSLTISRVQDKGEVSYDVKFGVGCQQTDSSSSMYVVFIKRVAVVTADKTISSQFLVMNLTDYSLEHMYLLLKDMMNPLFSCYTRKLRRYELLMHIFCSSYYCNSNSPMPNMPINPSWAEVEICNSYAMLQ